MSRHSDTSNSNSQWSAILAGIRTEWQQLVAVKSLLVVLLLLPLLYASTVAYLYRHESVVDAPVVVVDQDRSKVSNRLVWLIDATGEAKVVERLQSVDEAFARMRRHETSAVVFIPEGFEQRLTSAEPAKVKLWIDSANMLTYGTVYTGIRGAVSELDNEHGVEAFIARGATRRQAERRTSPIDLTERLLFHPTASYGAFMAPAVFVVALQQAILLGFALSVGSRREATGRADVDEPRAYSRLLGRYVVHLPFHLASAAVLSWLIAYWYGFAAGSALCTFILLSALAVAAGPLSILVSLPFTNGRTPLQVLMLVSTPLFLASGYTWPLEQLPRIVQLVAKLVPSTPGLLGLRIAAISSGKLVDLGPSLQLLVLQGAGYVVAGALIVMALRRTRLTRT